MKGPQEFHMSTKRTLETAEVPSCPHTGLKRVLGYIYVHHGPLNCILSCLMTAQLHCDPQFTWGYLMRRTSVYLNSLKKPLCWPEEISVHLRGVEVPVKASVEYMLLSIPNRTWQVSKRLSVDLSGPKQSINVSVRAWEVVHVNEAISGEL